MDDPVEQMITAYRASLEVFTPSTQPTLWADLQANLAGALRQRAGGDKAQNLDDAIAAYQAALGVYTREANPLQWAAAQHNMGNAYIERKRGDRAENIERAIVAFLAAAQVYTREAQPELWAKNQTCVGNAYDMRIAGKRSENIEQAINAYSAVLQVYHLETDAPNGALAQLGLGNTFLERERGDRGENIEQAIAALQAGLRVLTRENKSGLWFLAMGQLAAAYIKRTRGDLAQNLEEAIAICRSALQSVSPSTDLPNWSTLTLRLADALRLRIKGDPAQNLEDAVALCREVLRVVARDAHPQTWAVAQHDLANILRSRIRGDHAQNLENAIAACQAALQIRTREAMPHEWAMTQLNLGNAYMDRVIGDRADNQEHAIAALQAALEVFTREAYPLDWALTTNSLALAYSNRETGDHISNLNTAIAALEAILSVYTREKTPVEWARTQLNLGSMYSEDYSRKSDDALAAYRAAMTVYTREAFPVEWASIQLNMGLAYRQHITLEGIQTKSAQNERDALAAYQAALAIFTPETAPLNYLNTILQMGYVYESLGQWEQAHDCYQKARETQRDLLGLATGQDTLQAIIADFAQRDLYVRDMRTLLCFPQPPLATVIEVLEEGRAQALRIALDQDAIDIARFDQPTARERLDRFIAAREAWRTAQRALAEPLTPDIEQAHHAALSGTDRDQLEQAHTIFVQARDAIRQYDDPEFLSPARSIVDIARAVRAADKALVYLIADHAAGYAFVLTHDEAGKERIHRVDLPDLTTDAVNALLLGLGNTNQLPSDGLIYAQMGWAAFYLPRWGATPRAALHALPGTSGFALALRQTLDRLTDQSIADIPFTSMTAAERALLDAHFVNNLLDHELQRALGTMGDLGLSTLAQALQQLGIHALAIVPYGRLALFPLPSVLIRFYDQTQRLGEIFDVTLTPAARTLEVARDRMQTSDTTHQTILAAGNPWPLAWEGGNLTYAEAEADTIKRIAGHHHLSRPVLKYTREQVSRDHVLAGLNHAWYAHLALHGSFDPTNPRRSRIILRGTAETPENERVITLHECLDGTINLKGMRLLVLSACETAVIQADQSANEMIGLAPAFAQAGAGAVIAALWPVSDHATYLLMARFANLFLDPRRNWSPARCLAEAQRWLRDEATNALLASNDFDPSAPIPLPASALSESLAASSSEPHQPPKDAAVALESAVRSLRYNQTSAMSHISILASLGDPNERPYAAPQYWAAFTVTGW